MAGVVLGTPSNCYGPSGGASSSWSSGGNYSSMSGGAPTGSYSYWSQALNSNVYVWNRADCDAKLSSIADTTKKSQEIQWCYQALNSAPTGGSWSSGSSYSMGGSYTGSMKNCTYPNASQNGRTFKASCEGDYYNCKDAATGVKVENMGLSLGAPTECDGKPWTGGSYSGNTYSSGGMYGAGAVRSRKCTYPNGKILWCVSDHVNCSDSPNGYPWTDSAVGTQGSTANCVNDSGSTGGWNSSGGGQWSSSSATTQDQCLNSCSAAFYTDNAGYDNCKKGCVGGWQSSAGGGGTQDEMITCCPACLRTMSPNGMVCAAVCTQTRRSQCTSGYVREDENKGGGDMNLWYQKNNVQSMVTNLMYQVKQLIDAAKNSNVDITTEINSFRTSLEGAGKCLMNAMTQLALTECDNQVRGLDGTVQGIWEKIKIGSVKRRSLDAQEQLSRMAQFITNTRGDQTVVSRLNQLYGAAKGAVIAAQNSSDDGVWQSVYATLSAFWDAAQQTQYYGGGNGGGDQRGHSDLSEICAHLKQEISRRGQTDAGVAQQLSDLVSACLSQMAQLSTAGNFTESDVRTSMESIWQKFESIMSATWSQDACAEAKRVIMEAETAMSGEALTMIAAVEKIDSTGIVGKMRNLLNVGQSIVAKAKSAANCNDSLAYLSSMEEQVAQPFMNLFKTSGVSMKNFKNVNGIVDHSDDYAEFGEQYYEGNAGKQKEIVQRLEEKNYDSKQLLILKKLSKEAVEHAVGGDDSVDIVDIASQLNIEDVRQIQELLSARDALKEEIKNLEAKRDGLKKDVVAMIDTMQNYIAHPEYQDVMQALLQKAASGKLTGKQLEEEFRKTVETPSQREFKNDGTIAFEDVRLNDWSARYANEAYKRGLIGGINGKFEGGRKTNGAEVMKMVAEMLGGVDEDAEATSRFAGKAPAWAKGAVATLEENGFDPDEIFQNPSDNVTRKQAAVMFAALFPLPEADEDVLEDYKDLAKVTDDERAAIAQMVAAGIMTGNGDLWNPDGAFNRDQFTKVAVLIMNASNEDSGDLADEDGGSYAAAKQTGSSVGDEVVHAAAEESSSSSVEIVVPKTPSSYPATEQQLALIRARFEAYRALPENSKLSTDREVMHKISLLRDTSVSLAGVQEYFDKMRKQENMPEVYIAKQTKDMRLQLTDEQFEALGDALGEW